MLNALKSLWSLVVKMLTLGTQQGHSYLDSKKDPVLEIENNIQRLSKSKHNMQHRYFEVEKDRRAKERDIETFKNDLDAIKKNIKQLMKDGKEDMAKLKAKTAMQKEKSLVIFEQSLEQLSNRKENLELRVAKVESDIEILKMKKSDLKTMINMRDDSKESSGLDSDTMKSIEDIIKDADSQIDEVTDEDEAYQTTKETFSSEPVEDESVDEYLKNLSK